MQLTLFDNEHEEVIIPADVISPLECSKGVKTAAFRKVQDQWSKYVHAVQQFEGCSWFEASGLVVKHRESQEPIKVIWE